VRYALERRGDDTTTRRFRTAGAFGAIRTKATKRTKPHKENLVSLLRRTTLLTSPRFARCQEGEPLIFHPDFVVFVSFVGFVKSAEGAA
jgi:hypothetical protein